MPYDKYGHFYWGTPGRKPGETDIEWQLRDDEEFQQGENARTGKPLDPMITKRYQDAKSSNPNNSQPKDKKV